MSEIKSFDEEEFEKEEAALFAGEDDTEIPESKGGQLIPRRITLDFIQWLYDYHPEIRSTRDLSHSNIMYYVQRFERAVGIRSEYTANDWIVALR